MPFLDAIYIHRYRLFLTPVDELELPAFKGAALRGVFGHALRRVACVITDEECGRCPLRESCAYAILFESFPPDEFPDADKFRSFPRPYLFNPPLSRQRVYRPGEPLVFNVVLVGRAVEYLPYVISAFEDIGRAGFSKGRGRFRVTRVESVGADGFSVPVYLDGTLNGTGTPITYSSAPVISGGAGGVTLHFITPARIEINGKLQDSAPAFAVLMRMLAQRAALLAALFCNGGAPETFLTPALARAADAVRLVDADISWREHERYSSRQKSRLRQGGIVGSAFYQGPTRSFMQYLRLMEHLNIGKSTTFGLGRIALSFS